LRHACDVDPTPETEIDTALTTHPLFVGLPQPLLDKAKQGAVLLQVRNGHRVFRQDAPAENMFLVLQGSVVVEVPALVGHPAVIQRLGPGAPLGWSWLLAPYHWHFDCRAAEPAMLLSLDGRELREFCDAHPEHGYELVKRIASLMQERLEAARRQVMRLYDGEAGPG